MLAVQYVIKGMVIMSNPIDVESVRAVEADHARAMSQGDVGALRRLIAVDYTHVQASGAVRTREQFLAEMSGHVSFEVFDIDELTVRLYNGVAVATGAYHADVRLADRVLPRRYGWFMRVWVYEHDRWRNLAHQATNQPT